MVIDYDTVYDYADLKLCYAASYDQQYNHDIEQLRMS